MGDGVSLGAFQEIHLISYSVYLLEHSKESIQRGPSFLDLRLNLNFRSLNHHKIPCDQSRVLAVVFIGL